MREEACDVCGAAAGHQHRLRCSRQFDEQEEARAFEESAGVQFAMIGSIVAGIVGMVLVWGLAFLLGIIIGFPILLLVGGAIGWFASKWLHGIAEKRARAR